jgi:universal stress protein A
MNAYQQILVAVDIYSEHTVVLQRALAIAQNTTQIHLVYVNFPHIYFESYGYALGTDFFDENQKKAKLSLQNLATQHDISLEQVHTPLGDAAAEIHELANKINADLIIIGTHGQSGLKLLLGSTANAVLHGVKCDVLAVKV